MFSMPLTPREGEQPPAHEILVAAVAVGYGAGFSAGTGSQVQQVVGAVTVAALPWLWNRWRR